MPDYGLLSLLPPVLTVILAIWTPQYSCLLVPRSVRRVYDPGQLESLSGHVGYDRIAYICSYQCAR